MQKLYVQFLSAYTVCIAVTFNSQFKIMRAFSVKILMLFIIGTIAGGCKKDAGEGGNSSIHGYVHVTDYNSTFTLIQGEYDGADEEVYIIYGDDIAVGDRIRASHDGTFEFPYLREGKYTIYVYQDDPGLSGKSVVSKEVEITKKKQKVDAGTFEIKKQ